MFSRFFIDRPIFAAVLSIVITLAGGDRASSRCRSRSIPHDRAADGRRSTATTPAPAPRSSPRPSPRRSSSRSTASRTCCTCRRSAPTTARYNLTVTFKLGIDLNMAQVLVQNRVNLAMPQLPDVVKQTGVTVRKTLARHPAGRQPHLARRPLRPALPEQLRRCMQIKDELARAAGRQRRASCSASATTACASGSTRSKLAARELTAGDVVARHPRAERRRSPPGRSASRPIAGGQAFAVHRSARSAG